MALVDYDPYDMAHVCQIVEMKGNEAKVCFQGVCRWVDVSLVAARVGDYVLVHAGYAIKVLSERDVEEDIKLKIKSLLSDG